MVVAAGAIVCTDSGTDSAVLTSCDIARQQTKPNCQNEKAHTSSSRAAESRDSFLARKLQNLVVVSAGDVATLRASHRYVISRPNAT